MNKLILLFVMLMLGGFISQAQRLTLKMGENDMFSSLNNSEVKGTVYIIQDAALVDILKKHSELNASISHVPGYRLQVFFSATRTARQEAEAIQKRFKSSNSNHAVYLEYKAPYWKVKIGDFKSKSDALRAKNEMSIDFPNSWIIKEMVEKKPTVSTED